VTATELYKSSLSFTSERGLSWQLCFVLSHVLPHSCICMPLTYFLHWTFQESSAGMLNL